MHLYADLKLIISVHLDQRSFKAIYKPYPGKKNQSYIVSFLFALRSKSRNIRYRLDAMLLLANLGGGLRWRVFILIPCSLTVTSWLFPIPWLCNQQLTVYCSVFSG